MNKKMIKIFSVITIIMLLVSVAFPTFASEDDSDNYSKFTINDNAKTLESRAEDTSGASNSIGRIAAAALNIVRIIAVAAAVIMLIVLAIKYISSAPNDKAEIKKHAVVYVVGAILLFSASGILGIIQNFAGLVY